MIAEELDIGLIGLGVMGENLVLNMEDKGFSVGVYNRTSEKTDRFLATRAKGKRITGFHSLEELCFALSAPRRLMLLVKAGGPVDAVIEQLLPHLSRDDIIMDGGNSFYKDTGRRVFDLKDKGIRYLGTGISGGEEGALHGPSIMPGGSPSAWEAVAPVLQAIAARVNGEPCCRYLGKDGAGHFVKMVHNGIEYALMECITECYGLLRNNMGFSPGACADIFAGWIEEGEVASYLMEITERILRKKDPGTGRPLIELILDKAEQKGTGLWTSLTALELGASVPTINEAVDVRSFSRRKEERELASELLPEMKSGVRLDEEVFVPALHDALYAGYICAYAQGFSLLREGSKEFGWELDLGGIAFIWRNGCIIRANILKKIQEMLGERPEIPNLILSTYFRERFGEVQAGWRNVISKATAVGAPVPALASTLSYYDRYRGDIPINLIQAQRDHFGAHTYRRKDKEGVFHTEWKTE